MKRAALTRSNLFLEVGKVRQLRKVLQSRSNSEAVRRVIDERLAAGMGLQACGAFESSEAPRRYAAGLERRSDDSTA